MATADHPALQVLMIKHYGPFQSNVASLRSSHAAKTPRFCYWCSAGRLHWSCLECAGEPGERCLLRFLVSPAEGAGHSGEKVLFGLGKNGSFKAQCGNLKTLIVRCSSTSSHTGPSKSNQTKILPLLPSTYLYVGIDEVFSPAPVDPLALADLGLLWYRPFWVSPITVVPDIDLAVDLATRPVPSFGKLRNWIQHEKQEKKHAVSDPGLFFLPRWGCVSMQRLHPSSAGFHGRTRPMEDLHTR